MTEHFVTLFDISYAARGLALYRSLLKHSSSFELWVVCMDKPTEVLLKKLNYANINILSLEAFEDVDLLNAKTTREWGEYCWTVTPFSFKFVFSKNQSIDRLTYIDADIWFRKSPQLILKELDNSGKKVLITDHGYSPEFDQSATSGQYCVQFLTFYRKGPERLLLEWQKQCLQWCFNRIEDGKFGDQKYLDVWPDLYPDIVHVLERQDRALAPWNATRFPYGNSVFWHFHLLKYKTIPKSNLLETESLSGHYPIPEVAIKNVYEPYLEELRSLCDTLRIIQ